MIDHTCPIIDDGKNFIIEYLEVYTSKLLSSANPAMVDMLTNDEYTILCTRNVVEFMDKYISEQIELLRTCNSDLRESAEDDIKELNEEIEELKDNVADLEERLEKSESD